MLIDYYRQGRFPFDRLIRFYEFEDIATAFQDMQRGDTIGPVLRISLVVAPAFLQQRLQLAVVIHLERDVAAADELAVHVELRIGGPVRVLFSASRSSGSSKMFTCLKFAPSRRRACTVCGGKAALGRSLACLS